MNYFDDERDRQVLVEGLFIHHNLTKTKSLAKYVRLLNNTMVYQACGEPVEENLASFYPCLTEYATLTGYHPVGTCRMGKEDDPMAVLDERLHVRGT